MTIEYAATCSESPPTRWLGGMYFVSLTRRPFDVTDESLEVWAAEELRASRRSADAQPVPVRVGS